MSILYAIPYTCDETATAWCDPIGVYIKGQIIGTRGQLVELSKQLSIVVDLTATDDVIRENIQEEINFDQLAFVEECHLKGLAELSRVAIDGNHDDSGWYEACADYNDTLAKLAEFTTNL